MIRKALGKHLFFSAMIASIVSSFHLKPLKRSFERPCATRGSKALQSEVKGLLQTTARDAVLEAYRNGSSRSTVVLPGGAGKTVLGLRVAEALVAMSRGANSQEATSNLLVLVLVPALDLVSQTYREWHTWKESPGPLSDLKTMAVCSSVVAVDSRLTRSTDPVEIARFLRTFNDQPRLILSTYHSAAKVAQALFDTGQSIDLAVFDEAHKTTGVASKREARPLSDDFLAARRRLFLTATPRIFSSSGLRDINGDAEPAGSMANEDLYGPVVYRLGYEEAVSRGVVVPLKLVFLETSEVYERMVTADPELRVGVADQTISRENAELALAALDCRAKLNVTTAFAFFSSNKRSSDFYEAVRIALAGKGVAVGRVDGSMNAKTRSAVLAPLRGARSSTDILMVTNCRVLSEGTDVPAVDLVIFGDDKTSHTSILQSMARASRVSPGKTCGYVLIPVSAEGEDRFSTALSVMRAYAEQDDNLLEGLRALATEESRVGKPLPPSMWPEIVKNTFDLSTLDVPLAEILAERMVGAIARNLADGWDIWFGALLTFQDREGHSDVPLNHVENGLKLGTWLSSQRQLFKSGQLPLSRLKKLEEVGVKWSLSAENWEAKFNCLEAFQRREGHTNVPFAHVENGVQLGRWLQTQRRRHRGDPDLTALDDEAVQRLEAIGIQWGTTEETAWNANFMRLEAFQRREGHCLVPKDHIEDGARLGSWLDNQRTRYRARQIHPSERKSRLIPLGDDEVVQLATLGVRLDADTDSWRRKYNLLLEFKEREGHCDVPRRHMENDAHLGSWVATQRLRHKARDMDAASRKQVRISAMSDEEAQLLSIIGFKWNVRTR